MAWCSAPLAASDHLRSEQQAPWGGPAPLAARLAVGALPALVCVTGARIACYVLGLATPLPGHVLGIPTETRARENEPGPARQHMHAPACSAHPPIRCRPLVLAAAFFDDACSLSLSRRRLPPPNHNPDYSCICMLTVPLGPPCAERTDGDPPASHHTARPPSNRVLLVCSRPFSLVMWAGCQVIWPGDLAGCQQFTSHTVVTNAQPAVSSTC